jgi:hypothetical protein
MAFSSRYLNLVAVLCTVQALPVPLERETRRIELGTNGLMRMQNEGSLVEHRASAAHPESISLVDDVNVTSDIIGMLNVSGNEAPVQFKVVSEINGVFDFVCWEGQKVAARSKEVNSMVQKQIAYLIGIPEGGINSTLEAPSTNSPGSITLFKADYKFEVPANQSGPEMLSKLNSANRPDIASRLVSALEAAGLKGQGLGVTKITAELKTRQEALPQSVSPLSPVFQRVASGVEFVRASSPSFLIAGLLGLMLLMCLWQGPKFTNFRTKNMPSSVLGSAESFARGL